MSHAMLERMPSAANLSFLEFFAGGGLVRVGLGPSWRCLFANDVDPMKCAAYRANFGGVELVETDIAALNVRDLPAPAADLAWASFPCQDLSLAGARRGLSGGRSRLFFDFMRLMGDLKADARAPRTIVIENVAGLLSSNGGRDFAAVATALADLGHAVSAMVLNASAFTPQSRPRLFIFGFSPAAEAPFGPPAESDPATPAALRRAVGALPARVRRGWRWLQPRPAARRNSTLSDIVDAHAADWSADLGARALRLMSPRQRAAIGGLLDRAETRIGAAFFRVRTENGEKVQRLEARFDGLAGCLRTPAGGSSRQLLLLVDRAGVRARRLNPREAARLMGAPERYVLPARTTDALKVMGDGVAPPVVRWIAEAILEPALRTGALAA